MEDILNDEVDNKLSNEYVLTDDGTITRRKATDKTSKQQSNIIVPNTTPRSPYSILNEGRQRKADKAERSAYLNKLSFSAKFCF